MVHRVLSNPFYTVYLVLCLKLRCVRSILKRQLALALRVKETLRCRFSMTYLSPRSPHNATLQLLLGRRENSYAAFWSQQRMLIIIRTRQ